MEKGEVAGLEVGKNGLGLPVGVAAGGTPRGLMICPARGEGRMGTTAGGGGAAGGTGGVGQAVSGGVKRADGTGALALENSVKGEKAGV